MCLLLAKFEGVCTRNQRRLQDLQGLYKYVSPCFHEDMLTLLDLSTVLGLQYDQISWLWKSNKSACVIVYV